MEKVKDSLIDSNIISGNGYESVKVSYVRTDGQSSNVESTANHDDVTSTPSNFSKLTQIDISKQNIDGSDFNTKLDANATWKSLTKIRRTRIVKTGDKVTIHSKDSNDPKITGTVGQDFTDHKGFNLNKRDINKITIE